MKKTLDLGSGPTPQNPFGADMVFGVDLESNIGRNIYSADLAIESIPFPSEEFDYVTAYHFLEHVPRVVYAPARRNSFVELMNEIHRVLKVKGIFYSVTTAYPHVAAFQDPTHVNYLTEETFVKYFDEINCWAKIYGFRGRFRIINQTFEDGLLICIMEKL